MASSRPGLALALFAIVLSLMAVDIVADLQGGDDRGSHVALEGLVMAVALLGAVIHYRLWRQERASARRAVLAARSDVASWRAEAERWRAEAQDVLRGLGAAVDRQLTAWQLTEAEREVALLVLKGLSHKEIASVRGTSERTARDQARAVYQKAGLAGRAELAAFFLEDLLVLEPHASKGPGLGG